MQFTVDTRNATAFELTALAELVAKLASVAPAEATYIGEPTHGISAATYPNPQNIPKNDGPDNSLGNDAPTVIPPVPASATASENPPAVPAVPSVTPATGASAVPAVPSDQKLDSAGFPWDARIHTANKAVIGDGTWRKKPGVDMALYAAVQAEWTAASSTASGVPAAPVTQQAAPVPDVPNAANTGATSAVQSPVPDVPAVPTLSAQDVLARCTEINMADASKGAPLFQAIVAAGVPGGPMSLMGVTDPAILAACLAAVNAVGAA